jgi:4-alpha-glucanotransferase
MQDVEESIQRRRDQIIGEWLAPVIVAWDGNSDCVSIRVPSRVLPSHAVGPRLQYTLHLENGDIWSGNVLIDQARTLRHLNCAGEIASVKAFMPARALPFGYHKLTVLIGTRAFQSFVISSPSRSYEPSDSVQRRWGIFAPVYALTSERNWGAGDFSDAEVLVSWTGEQGGSLFGTLPFLASYLDHPCDPSPYTPISRFFWNEFLIDVTRLPELADCLEAQELIASPGFQSELSALRQNRLIDYRQVMKLKREVLLHLSRHMKVDGRGRRDLLLSYTNSNPELQEYARFRAETKRRGEVWTRWASSAPLEGIGENTTEREEADYHSYVQCVADEQIGALTKRCAVENVTLYLDYPLGTHAEGFDTWKYRDQFALNATVGAPPDPVFTTGQNWGFHPLLPDVQRRDGYSYFARSLRHQMRHAGMLRLDHVMGLHRMYWIPQGFHKSEGVYVHYPSEEIYAVLMLESHRTKTVLVGENLGIVPGYVSEGMRRHGLAGMNVAYWEIASDPDGALHRMEGRPNTVASLNTHDMFPFAAFWNGLDAGRRAELGMITHEHADLEKWLRGELRGRLTAYLREHGFAINGEEDTAGALLGILVLLSRSKARWVLVNLEDLWLETSPQNIPDTVDEHPNWRQKTKLSLENCVRDDSIRSILKNVSMTRNSVNG